MMKNLVVLCACFGLVAGTVSCTSTSSETEQPAEYEDVAAIEAADGAVEGDSLLMGGELGENEVNNLSSETSAKTSGSSTEETVTTEITQITDENGLENVSTDSSTEVLPADPLPDALAATPEITPDADATDIAGVDANIPTPAPTSSEVAMSETTTTTTTETTQTTSSSDSSLPSESIAAFTENKPKATGGGALQKMAEIPWQQSGMLYNTVYFARPGDTLKSISMMIYGSDKSKDLKKGNPLFQNRGVKPGDKVYYQSPNRPTDDSRIITYYEDMGMSPEVYVAQEGDNLRTVSKKILGYSNAWKEIWSSNDVESQREIAAGTQLRYWKGATPVAATSAAENRPSQQRAEEAVAPTEVAQAPVIEAAQPPPAMDTDGDINAQLGNYVDQSNVPQDTSMAQADMPPPPPEVAADMPPPPPPPSADMAPPPPPPPVAANEGEEVIDGEAQVDGDMTLALGVVGIAAAGLAGLIVARKKRRQREAEEALQHTHVG